VTPSAIGQFIATDLLSDPDRVIATDEELLAGGLVDSMGIMNLVFFIEQQYGIQIDSGDVTIDNFGTLALIDAYLSRRTS
jgi:acyl carrier protein